MDKTSNPQFLPHGYELQGEQNMYVIDHSLGQGAFGITYLAKCRTKFSGQMGTGTAWTWVCVKEFFIKDMNSRDEQTGSLRDASDNSLVSRYYRAFLREARNLSRMQHPNIVNVFEVIVANNTAYIVMEYKDGGSLDEYIASKGRLSEDEALRLFEPICDAMNFMHAQHMLHLDLKPKNVMLDEEGTPFLIDFGLSKQFTADGKPDTTTSIGLGTPGYAPLEQGKRLDKDMFHAELDVYALGGTLYKMLTGVTPPEATEVSESVLDGTDLIRQNLLAAGISVGTAPVVSKAMHPSSRKRYQNVAELMAALKSSVVNTENDLPGNVIAQKAETETKDETVLDDGEKDHSNNEKSQRLPKLHSRPFPKWPISVFAGVTALVIIVLSFRNHGKKETNQDVMKYGSLEVTSTPSNAMIYIDGEEQNGNTPLTLENLPWGDHEVKICLGGYETQTKIVSIAEGSNPGLFVILKPKTQNRFDNKELQVIGVEHVVYMNGEGEEHTNNYFCLRGNALHLNDTHASADAGHLLITFEKELVKGDMLEFDGFSNGTTTGLQLVFSNGYKMEMTFKDGRVIIVANEETAGSKSVLVTRTNASDDIVFINKIVLSPISNSNDGTSKYNGHEYVDLGLSVMWATCNIGASSPNDYGYHYAWGETTTKSNYNWETLKYRTSGDSNDDVKFSKYVTLSRYGVVDNKKVLDLSDDAACVNWGGSWRMPTDDEWTELRTKCTWAWTNQGGHNGYKVTSKSNGKSIFLPASGYFFGTDLFETDDNGQRTRFQDVSNYGEYWSSSLKEKHPYAASTLLFSKSGGVWNGSYNRNRCYGYNIRPVLFSTPVTEEMKYGSLRVTSEPSGATIYVDGKSQAGKTTPEVLEKLTIGNHKIRLVLEGYEEQTKTVTVKEGRNVNLSVTLKLSSVVSQPAQQFFNEITQQQEATQQTSQMPPAQSNTSVYNGHEYVDLGLSVMWATCNVGASSPSAYGNYYAWGETSTKSDYSWETLKYCNDKKGNSFSKYVPQSGFGSVDNKKVLDISDDAARVNWGGDWRMPTDDEWTELRTECTWTWTNQGGHSGYKVTSKSNNGNSIFLPAAGNRSETSLYNAGTEGLYWIPLLNENNPSLAWVVTLEPSYVGQVPGAFRCAGYSVRPVCHIMIQKADYNEKNRSSSLNSTTSSNSYFQHVVKAGETIYHICKKYGITPEGLYSANPFLRTEALKVGQILNIKQ